MAFKILSLLFSTVAFGQLRTTDFQQSLSANAPRNYIKNSGIEKNAANITDANAIAGRVTVGVLEGVGSLEINAGSATQKVVFLADDLQAGLLGQSCEASFSYSGDASLYKAYVQLGGVTVSAEQTLTNTGSSAQPISLNFPCGASTTDDPTLHIEATGDGAAITVDSVYLGKALNIGSSAQPEPVVRAFRSSTNQTISSAADTKLEFNAETYDVYNEFDPTTNFRFTAKRAGRYKVNAQSFITLNGDIATNITVAKNSTNVCLSSAVNYSGSEGRPQVDCFVDLAVGDFIEIRKGAGTDAATQLVAGSSFSFVEISRYPTTSEQVFRVGAPGQDWTAYTPTGSLTTNATYTGFYKCSNGDLRVQTKIAFSGTNTQGSAVINLPSGFTVDTSKLAQNDSGNRIIGKSMVYDLNLTAFHPGYVGIDSATSVFVPVINAASTYGLLLTTNTNTGVPITIASGDYILIEYTVPVTASSPCPSTPSPLLAGSVSSSSVGAERVERATISGAAVIVRQSGNFLSSCSVSDTSLYTCAFTNTWPEIPSCNVTYRGTTANLHAYDATTSTTELIVRTETAGSGAKTQAAFNVICQGRR